MYQYLIDFPGLSACFAIFILIWMSFPSPFCIIIRAFQQQWNQFSADLPRQWAAQTRSSLVSRSWTSLLHSILTSGMNFPCHPRLPGRMVAWRRMQRFQTRPIVYCFFWWNSFLVLAIASVALSWVSISNGLLWYCTILTPTELCLFFSSMHWMIKSGLALAFLPRDSAEIASELASLLSLLVRLADLAVGVLSKFWI